MSRADKISLVIVFALMLLVATYEYRVSVRQIPSTGGVETAQTPYLGITARELSQSIEAGAEMLLIDLRPQGEFARGHIPSAISIPFAELEKRATGMEKETRVVIYCESGPWSRIAYRQLKNMGFTNLRILINGFVGWKWEINGNIRKSS